MDRYRAYAPLDDVPLNDGDTYFLGFYSRFQPTYLKSGQLFYAGNMRLDKGTAKVRKGLKALSNDITTTNPILIVGSFSLVVSLAVTSITRAVNTATVTTATNHGFSTGNIINIAGATQTDYNGDYTITVTGLTTFTYTVANTPTTPATGTILANHGPLVFNAYNAQVVGSGDYADDTTNTEGIIIASTDTSYLYRYGTTTITLSYPAGETVGLNDPCDIRQFLNKVYMFRGYSRVGSPELVSVTSITRSGTTATITLATTAGLLTNEWLNISGASPNGYNGIVYVTKTSGTTLTYTVDGALATPATGTITYRRVKPPLYWDMNIGTHAWAVVPTGPNPAGAPIINMPAVDWGTIFKSRLVLPWSRDQLVFSDVLDVSSYDPSQTQFRILPGTADWLIAAFPYQQARLLVLYRKSVHTVFLDGSLLTIASAYEVTRNFGCVARKTVANCGPYIVWLSDIGVVKMEIGNELSLTNAEAPLSDPIDDIISTINWTYASKAVAVFWNNRYYIAVPTGTSTVNNTILVYNFLNAAWESADTYPGGYDVVNFHVISYNGSKRIHSVGTFGYVSLLEENEVDQFGSPGHEADYEIAGSLKTRNYLAGTLDIKKVKRFQLEANVTNGDAFSSNYVLSNPDYTANSLNYVASDTTDITLRKTVNRRGVSSRLEISTTSGRPEFKAVSVESAVSSRATLNYA